MKYFIDTEFIECAKQRRVLGVRIGPPVPTIDLISIALVAEDGREFYALNADCELAYAWENEWVRKNVLLPIWNKNVSTALKYSQFMPFQLSTMQQIFKAKGLTRQQLTGELCAFVFPLQFLADELNKVLTVKGCDVSGNMVRGPGVGEYYDRKEAIEWGLHLKANITPDFYGYYCDYDWVVFCQLFGRMIDLPTGFPMFCLDLKQEIHRLGITSEQKRALCPDPEGEHDALVDARWNKKLHEALERKASAFILLQSSEQLLIDLDRGPAIIHFVQGGKGVASFQLPAGVSLDSLQQGLKSFGDKLEVPL